MGTFSMAGWNLGLVAVTTCVALAPVAPPAVALQKSVHFVGALAHEAGALVWSLDADFRRMARLKLIAPYD
jgi:hypothetical protein